VESETAAICACTKEETMDRFVILANDSMNRVSLFGTPTGRPFTSEEQANRWKKKMDPKVLNLDLLVLPINTMPEEVK
jgi:hypothetical protein